ncbi:uncharacterized protein [Rhodnius prolixus]
MSDNSSFKCEICDQFFSTKFSLKRHIKVKHPPSKSCVLCETCGQSLSNGKLLSKHMETHYQMKNRLKCPLCGFLCYVSAKLNEHINSKHGVEIEEEILEFKSSEEFLKWKLNLEKNDTSKFVKYCGNSKIKDGSTRSYYYCHRSYVHKSYVLHRMKKLKKQGLTKIGAHCPARMKVLCKKDGAISVHYTKTHLGHEREICYINLSLDERKYLASLISKNMTFDEILNDIKKHGDFNNFRKLNLVTRTDLHNIRRSFHLYHDTTVASNRDDLIGLDVWVKQHLEDDANCILFYKSEDVRSEDYPNLPNNFFFLAIMTKDQETVLLQRQFTCTCMDVIQSNNISDRRFELVALSVIDNSRQEYPTAFLVTSKVNLESVEIFLTLIKNKVGLISANVFLSNMKDCCYDVWCKIMTTPNIKYYTSWNVSRRWRVALHKIISPEDESLACKIVKELIEEKDKQLFYDKLRTASESLCSNKKTRRFGHFFKEEFYENAESWARCFRTTFDLAVDIQLERIHRTLKYLFLAVKTLKRLDKSVIEITKFVQDEFFSKNKILTEELRFAKMREIDSRHRASLRLSLDNVVTEEHGWVVVSKSRTFHKLIVCDISPNCNCSLICAPCKVCIHRFCCSCNDSSVMWRMCKHIHLVCRAVGFTRSEKESIVCTVPNEVQNNKYNEIISCDTQLVNQLIQVEMNSAELDRLVGSINISGMISKTEGTIDQKKILINRKFTEIMELIKTENEANLLQMDEEPIFSSPLTSSVSFRKNK